MTSACFSAPCRKPSAISRARRYRSCSLRGPRITTPGSRSSASRGRPSSLSARPPRTARAPHDAAEPGGAGAVVARQRRSVHGHRIVKAFGAGTTGGDSSIRHLIGSTGRACERPVCCRSFHRWELVGGVALVLALWVRSREIAANRLTTGSSPLHHDAVPDTGRRAN